MPIVSPDIPSDQSQSGENIPVTDNPAVVNVGGGFVIPITTPDTSQSISLTSGGTELKQIQIPCGFVYHKIIFPKDTSKQVTHETTVLSADDSFMTTDKINVRVINLYNRTNLNISDGVRFYVHPELLLWLKTSKESITYYIFIPIDTRKLAPISLKYDNNTIDPEIEDYTDTWEWTTDDPTLPEYYEGTFIELMMKHKTFKFYDISEDISENRIVSLDKLRTIGACAHPDNIIVTNENHEIISQQSILEDINLSYELMGLCNLKDVVNDYTDNFNNYPEDYSIDDYRSYIPNTGKYKNIIDIVVSTIIYYYKLIDSNKIVQHDVNDFNENFNENKKNILTKFRNLDTSNCDNDFIWYTIAIQNIINNWSNAKIIGGSLDSFRKRKIYLKVKK